MKNLSMKNIIFFFKKQIDTENKNPKAVKKLEE